MNKEDMALYFNNLKKKFNTLNWIQLDGNENKSYENLRNKAKAVLTWLAPHL